MILAWLLARAGVDVIVLEKHADFLRDFRGDTVHPSTLELMYELGVLDEFLRLPHTEMDHLDLQILGERLPGPDFRGVSTHKLLTVVVDRLEHWWAPGLLCIGDAAHAMSPIGGVGINLAIQDAVAAANRLAEPLRARQVTTEDLAAVQARREPPTRKIQRLQLAIQSRVLAPVVAGRGRRVLRFVAFAMRHFASLRRMAAQTLGVGQLEHVASLDGQPETKVRPTATPSTSSEA